MWIEARPQLSLSPDAVAEPGTPGKYSTGQIKIESINSTPYIIHLHTLHHPPPHLTSPTSTPYITNLHTLHHPPPHLTSPTSTPYITNLHN
jgi:hypothetical protein